jgi:hypothetical protein
LVRLACRPPKFRGIDPENITEDFRRVMVIAAGSASGLANRRTSMHLNAKLPATCFKRPAAKVVAVGLEVEI